MWFFVYFDVGDVVELCVGGIVRVIVDVVDIGLNFGFGIRKSLIVVDIV